MIKNEMEINILYGTLVECTSYFIRLINEDADIGTVKQQADFCQSVIDKITALKLQELTEIEEDLWKI